MENNYNWEEFTSFKGKFTPKISLGKSGGFGFSSGFYHHYKLENSKAIKIFYDKEKMAVGFQFFMEEKKDAIKLKDHQSGGYIAAVSFLKKYSINPAFYYGRYDPKEIKLPNGETMYVIQLAYHT